MTDKISPLPWALNKNVPDCINDARGDFFLTATSARNGNDEANAAFIVRACNSHYQLVEALKKFANLDKSVSSNLWAIRAEYCEQARAALTAAENP